MRNEAIAAIVAKHVPAAGGAAGIVLFGAPAGMLIAAFLGAALSFYFKPPHAETRIPMIVFGVVALAFSGTWIALALPHVGLLGIGAAAGKIDPSVRAGLCALAFQSFWNLGNRFLERKVETA